MRTVLLALAATVLIPATARADDDGFCPDRPGLGTPACTVQPGHPMVEIGLAGWDHSSDNTAVSDSVTLGDLAARIGLDDRTEAGFGLTSYGSDRTRDRASGAVARQSGLGDATVWLKRSLSGAGGPVAVQAFVTLPTGASGVGAGDWGAGLIAPVNLGLAHGFEIDLTPEVDAAVNASGSGRHLAWGGVLGLAHDLGPHWSGEVELGAWRDLDPSGHSTDARLALSAARRIGADWQIDFEVDLGLASAAPDHSLMIGIAHRL